jgi:predicted aspartyl protease
MRVVARKHEVRVEIEVRNLADQGMRARGVALVDTGATLSTVPRSVVGQLALPIVDHRRTMTATGARDVDIVGLWTEIEGIRRPSAAIVGDGEYLVGLADLETRGLAVDPMTERLVPSPLRS